MSAKDVLSISFSAIVGQEDAKLALLVAAVSPHIHAVLLKGESGTAKTVLARSIQGIDPGRTLINVPQNVTDEQLFGTIDLDKALSGQAVELGDSILQRAHGNYIYVDDCDLLDIHTLMALMDDVLEGRVRVERDGISTSYELDTTVIASMHSERRHFDSHVNDCFDICAVMRRDMNDIEGGIEVLRRNLLLTDDEQEAFAESDLELSQRVQKARSILRSVQVPRAQLMLISGLCQKYGVVGCRGAISTAQAARAIAALDGRLEVSDEDVSKAALLCIMHRRTKESEEEEKKQKEKFARWEKEYEESQHGAPEPDETEPQTEKETVLVENSEDPETKPENDYKNTGVTVGLTEDDNGLPGGKDIMDILDEAFEVVDLLLSPDSNGIRAGDEVAKRMFAESGDRVGKYVRSRIPTGQCTDIAFDATIRAAAPFQRVRGAGDGRVVINKSDLREKVREKEVTSTFMFVIDNSGSIVIAGALDKIKRAVNSMLLTHYVKRDRVGLMTFNEKAIEVRLHPSRAIDQLGTILSSIEAGSGTPLSEMLVEVQSYFRTYLLKHPDERVNVVVISDGKATVAMEKGNDPVDEALEIASRIDIPNLNWIIIDSGLSYVKNEVPEKLAALLHGKYFLLNDLQVKDEDAYAKWKKWNKDKYADKPMARR